MKIWTQHHAALLDALRAERYIPPLYRRLSRERYEADDEEWRRLSDWPSLLRKEAGWKVIEPVLEQPDAWPAAWHQATEAGWSETADHHHALLFGRLCERFIEDEEYEHALWSWTESWRAWKAVLGSGYMRDLMRDIAPIDEGEGEGDSTDADAEEADEAAKVAETHQKILLELLDHRIAARSHALRVCLSLDDEARSVEVVDRRGLRFGWNALLLLGEQLREVGEATDPHGTLRRVRKQCASTREQIATEVIARFERMIEALDLADAPSNEVLLPFEWIAEVFDIIGYTDYAVTTAVKRAVEVCWRMRKMGREDKTDDLPKILQLMAPFNKDLYRRLETGTSFGHNSKCADFLVFQGEPLTDHDARFDIFSRAVNISPGHRNASMLLSYEYLQIARAALTRSKATLATMRHMPGNKHEKTLKEVFDAIAMARHHYSVNERIPDYQEQLEQEAARLDVDLSQWEDKPRDANNDSNDAGDDAGGKDE